MLPVLAFIYLAAFIMSTSAQSTPHILVYTATKGYRHESIPAAIDVLGQQADRWNVSFTFTEDPSMFTTDTLSQFDGVMFALNSGEVLDDDGQAALQTFFQSGGVYTGVHSGSACLYNDTNYAQAVGALFDYHPELQSATFERLNDTHPATKNLPDRFTWEEEVYNFRSDPRSNDAVILLTVDENSYQHGGSSTGDYPDQGTPHPIAWYIESPKSALPLQADAPRAGRSFYTSLGHLNTTWQNDTFIDHLMGGLTWALEGRSTRAYGVGLVGNSSAEEDGKSTPSGTTSASVSESSGAAATSGAAGQSRVGSSNMGLTAAAVAGAIGAGIALVL
ncbi:trehalose utilization-domain-containing protein [Kockovaella imperatae]|uniref:Trehalose utilization-domain-containing protein n=1 Tax=Kockovaella imperatae TaxID=4999 RepID=A0A1Y1UR98_9TREE|nr:trehalose utilization-domain-containing protein [Kockovaella imperatae]ORX40570.1 trehalose utilization-domain-containing protein [Kockovaella imperatae]